MCVCVVLVISGEPGWRIAAHVSNYGGRFFMMLYVIVCGGVV